MSKIVYSIEYALTFGVIRLAGEIKDGLFVISHSDHPIYNAGESIEQSVLFNDKQFANTAAHQSVLRLIKHHKDEIKKLKLLLNENNE